MDVLLSFNIHAFDCQVYIYMYSMSSKCKTKTYIPNIYKNHTKKNTNPYHSPKLRLAKTKTKTKNKNKNVQHQTKLLWQIINFQLKIQFLNDP